MREQRAPQGTAGGVCIHAFTYRRQWVGDGRRCCFSMGRRRRRILCARAHTNAYAQWTVLGVRAGAFFGDGGGWQWRSTTTTAFHYRNPPVPPEYPAIVVLRPRPRPTAGRDTGTTVDDAARRTAGGSIRRDRNTVCVRPLRTAMVRWLARSIHTPETLQRVVAGRGRVAGSASGLLVSVGWVVEWAPRTIFPATKCERAHPIFHHLSAVGAIDRCGTAYEFQVFSSRNPKNSQTSFLVIL